MVSAGRKIIYPQIFGLADGDQVCNPACTWANGLAGERAVGRAGGRRRAGVVAIDRVGSGKVGGQAGGRRTGERREAIGEIETEMTGRVSQSADMQTGKSTRRPAYRLAVRTVDCRSDG